MRKLLIANRGEIAVRIARACQAVGVPYVMVFSEADRDMPYLPTAERAVCIGPPAPASSYLNGRALLATALGTGCDAIHPGYGFLSENADFAASCEAQGLTFVGPRPESIATMGDKLAGRACALAAGVPVVPGRDVDPGDIGGCVAAGRDVGFPLLIKASAGGGGRGMRVVAHENDLQDALQQASAEAQAAFADARVYLERYINPVHHVEVQIFGDGQGKVIALGERECSVQRRHQKLVEESPSPVVSEATCDAMIAAAIKLGASMRYRSAGTVEFIVDPETQLFYFIEMNTRIQVEHPVTEVVYGVDLVGAQLSLAAGEGIPTSLSEASPRGHAIEWRITAEDPSRQFLPTPGLITAFNMPTGEGIRVDTFVRSGQQLSPYYDSMLAKLIVHGTDRDDAINRSIDALSGCHVAGVCTPIDVLRRIAEAPAFRAGTVHTGWLEHELAALTSASHQAT